MSTSSGPRRSPAVRLSDNERNSAMAALGRAFAEGRLTIDEYDERCTEITRATTRSDLEPLFRDIPQNPDGSGTEFDVSYSAREIAAAHKSSRNTRLGIMSLTAVVTLAAVPALIASGFLAATTLYAVIPVVWILLYVMKVGPAQWHMPSPKQIEKERLREIQSADAIRNAERKAEVQARQAELREERQRLAGELTNEAMGIAKRTMDKFKK